MLKDLINDCGEFNEKTNLKIKWKSYKQMVAIIILLFLEIKIFLIKYNFKTNLHDI
jgi:hypothetical protein